MTSTILHSQNPESDPLAQWITRQLESVFQGRQVEQLVLGHLNAQDITAPMDRYAVRDHTEEAALRFTSQLRFLARQDAEQRGGLQRYAIQAHWPTDADEQPSYFAFSVDGSAVRNTELTSATEPPTSEGLVKMLMRHLEVTQRVAMKQTVDIQDETAHRERRLLDRINQLEEGRFKIVELTEQMLSAKAEREIEHERAKAQEARKDLALSEFTSLTPLLKPKLLEYLTGEKMGHGNGATDAVWRQIFEGMTIEEVKAMMATLPATKQMAFLELYRSTMNVPKAKPEEKAADKDDTSSGGPTAH